MKILVLSDTHGKHNELFNLDDADMIIHSGDFSFNEISFFHFIDWFSELNYKYKILIAGNHDHKVASLGKEKTKKFCEENGIIYLEDESVIIEGIKFYGSPWTLYFFDWEFMGTEEELEVIFSNIDKDTDVLITHGPQHGILDEVKNQFYIENTGSISLKNSIKKLKNLKFHLFGHIHEQYGVKRGKITSINSSIVFDSNRNRIKKPILFNI